MADAAEYHTAHPAPSGILPGVKQDFLGSLFAKGGFNAVNFPDIFYPVSFVAFGLLVAAIVLYNVQVRRLHRHPVLLNLQEWLLWTGICVFGLVLIEAIFSFYFAFVLVTVIVGCATFIWIRFVRFPPMIAGYNEMLRRARSFSAQKYKDPEATVRSRSTGAKAGGRPAQRGASTIRKRRR